MRDWGDLFNPFAGLAAGAGKLLADGWTAAMLGVWNAGLWLLRLVLGFTDSILTPDVSETGPGAWLYRVTFWLAGALLLIMAMVQLGTAVARRDGKSLARVAIGFAQFMVVWGGWLAYGVTFLAACSGLTRAMLQGLLKVSSWSEWEPWAPFSPADISDATVATVLGLMGLLLWIAAIGHFLVMLARAASLLVLMATTPIAAAGLVSDAGKAWFWKSLRWFHAAALSPVLMVLVLGVGVQFTTGVAVGLSDKLEMAVGTAVPGVILICVATVSPLALFKLLAFVDPATTSGAAMRTSLAAVGGVQGLLTGGGVTAGGGSSRAAATDQNGRSAGESGADDTTDGRFTSAIQAGMSGFGAVGAAAAKGLGLVTAVGAAGTSIGSDSTNQMGAGHPTYPPDFSPAGRRASYNSGGGQGGPVQATPGDSTDIGAGASDASTGTYPGSYDAQLGGMTWPGGVGPGAVGAGVDPDTAAFPPAHGAQPALPLSPAGAAGPGGSAGVGGLSASDAAIAVV